MCVDRVGSRSLPSHAMSDSSSSVPAAAEAAAGDATAGAAAPISLPFLYRHALESIFAFCHLRDLATFVQVNDVRSSEPRLELGRVEHALASVRGRRD